MPDRAPETVRRVRRRLFGARLLAIGFTGLTALLDVLPPGVRYGLARRLSRALLAKPSLLVTLAARSAVPDNEPRLSSPPADPTLAASVKLRCVLATGALDVGGVESVVAMLAKELPKRGVATVVLCSSGGRISESLRRAGVRVIETADGLQVRAALAEAAADVIQLHNAPTHIVEGTVGIGIPIVCVVHNTEIHRRPADWHAAGQIARLAHTTIAVSETVRDHFLRHVVEPGRDADSFGPVLVVPNGAPIHPADRPDVVRYDCRRALAAVLGRDPEEAVVLACLARYDAQKNIPGLIEAFLDAAEQRPRLHLIVAGGVSDWLEFRHADALRTASPHGDHVHLLGPSDSSTLLAGADAFVLDSFFEGWPVAATEAAVAGLPLVLADVGGAAELVGSDGHRGTIVANAAGPASEMGDRAVRRARRRVRHQQNRAAMCEVFVRFHDDVGSWASRRPALAADAQLAFGQDAMVEAHVAALRSAAARQAAVGRPMPLGHR